MDEVIGRGEPQFPVVPHHRFLPRRFHGLYETIAVLLRGKKSEMSGIHLVGLTLPD
jgi:hypothetical protein